MTRPTNSDNVEAAEQPAISEVDAAPDEVAEQPAASETAPKPETEDVVSETATKLNEELEAARAEAQRNFESLQRLQADFQNYKRRIERERAEISEKAVVDIFKTLLPVIDDFERSVENIPADLTGNSWAEGTVAIDRKLKRLLETYDIEPIDPVGEPFDPDKHQGLGIDEDSDMESGYVTTTLQKGYMKDDKILRPALVRVAG